MARKRSPAYPAVNLETAIARALSLYGAEHDNLVPVESVLATWKFGAKSGGGMALLAALKHYGLLVDKQTDSGRHAKLTALALDIILDEREGSADRASAIACAALKPTLHSELWAKWGATLPSDSTFKHHLVRERDFNPVYASKAIQTYRDTIEFADPESWGIIEESDADLEDEKTDNEIIKEPLIAMQGKTNGKSTTHGTLDVLHQAALPIPQRGKAILQWPDGITTDQFNQLEAWLTLMLGTIKQSIKNEAPDNPSTQQQT